MKIQILKTISFLLLVVLFISCNKEVSNEELILGTWEGTSVEYTGTTSSDLGDIHFSGSGYDINYTITFNETTYNSIGSYSVKLTSMVNGTEIVQNLENLPIEGVSDYSITESEIILSDGQETQTSSIDILTETELGFTIESNISSGGNISETISHYRFTKK